MPMTKSNGNELCSVLVDTLQALIWRRLVSILAVPSDTEVAVGAFFFDTEATVDVDPFVSC